MKQPLKKLRSSPSKEDSLNQKTREDLENLRNDVTIEMNNRKIATRAEQQNMQIKIQDLSNNFTKRLADMRTESEAQKWQTTRLLIGSSWSNELILVTLATLIICGLGFSKYLRTRNKEVPTTGVQTESRGKGDSASELETLG
jgi:ribosome-associated translation inhibitor RaiA